MIGTAQKKFSWPCNKPSSTKSVWLRWIDNRLNLFFLLHFYTPQISLHPYNCKKKESGQLSRHLDLKIGQEGIFIILWKGSYKHRKLIIHVHLKRSTICHLVVLLVNPTFAISFVLCTIYTCNASAPCKFAYTTCAVCAKNKKYCKSKV